MTASENTNSSEPELQAELETTCEGEALGAQSSLRVRMCSAVQSPGFAAGLVLVALGCVGAFLFAWAITGRSVSISVFRTVLFALPAVWVVGDGRWHAARMAPMAVFSGVFAAAWVFGARLDSSGAFGDVWPLLIVTALLACGFFPLACFACAQLDRAVSRSVADSQEGQDAPETAPKARKRFLLCCSAGLVLVWLLWYLVLFPGVYGYDGPFFLREHLDESTAVTSQFSVPFTWLYANVVQFGQVLFSSYEAGLALYTAVQMSFVLYSAVRCIRFIDARHGSKAATIACTAFFALNPVFPVLADSTAQDPAFMALFVLIVVNVVEALDDPESFKSSPSREMRLAVLVLALCLVRNNGAYALVISLAFVWLVQKGLRLRLALVFIVPVAAALVFQSAGYAALGVSTGTTLREMSSVPAMQLARTYVYDRDLRNQPDGKALESFISPEALESYVEHPEISDEVKAGLDVEAIAADPAGFAALYVRIGLTHPGEYVQAFALNTLGLWYPGKGYPDYRMYHPWIESEMVDAASIDPANIQIESRSFIPLLDRIAGFYLGGSQNSVWMPNELFAKLPLGSLFVKFGMYFALLVFATCYLVGRRRSQDVFIACLFWGLIATVLLGPVMLCRYVAPLMMATPALVSCMVKPTQHVNREQAAAVEEL